VGWWSAWAALVFALRFFAAHADAPLMAVDAPPPPAETRIAAVADDAPDADTDDPSDVDDDDDSDDDVALPANIAAAVPLAVEIRTSWPIRPLHDKHTCERLFRPPRRA
jgi:hypothetical protein